MNGVGPGGSPHNGLEIGRRGSCAEIGSRYPPEDRKVSTAWPGLRMKIMDSISWVLVTSKSAIKSLMEPGCQSPASQE